MTNHKTINYAVTPKDCHLWVQEYPDLYGSLEIVKDYTNTFATDADDARRSLKRCTTCGQLYFYEMLEWIDFKDGNDPRYSTCIPVAKEKDADKLALMSQFEILIYLPQIRYDFPKDKDSSTVYWKKAEPYTNEEDEQLELGRLKANAKKSEDILKMIYSNAKEAGRARLLAASSENDSQSSESQPVEEAEKEKPVEEVERRRTKTQQRQFNELKKEIEKANAEVYFPASKSELIDQGMTKQEAKVEAIRQQNEMETYNTRVTEAQLSINAESEKVLKEFPVFDPESDEYDKDLAEDAAELLQANLIYDENSGQIIGANISPYKLYKTLAWALEVGEIKGIIKAKYEDTEGYQKT